MPISFECLMKQHPAPIDSIVQSQLFLYKMAHCLHLWVIQYSPRALFDLLFCSLSLNAVVAIAVTRKKLNYCPPLLLSPCNAAAGMKYGKSRKGKEHKLQRCYSTQVAEDYLCPHATSGPEIRIAPAGGPFSVSFSVTIPHRKMQ